MKVDCGVSRGQSEHVGGFQIPQVLKHWAGGTGACSEGDGSHGRAVSWAGVG